MNVIIYHGLMLMLLLWAMAFQQLMPAIDYVYDAVPPVATTFFLCAACTVSFPGMLILAFVLGFIWDARYLYSHVDSPLKEKIGEVTLALGGDGYLPLGYTILLLGLAGALMQGVRPLFQRGRWEFPLLMVGMVTSGIWIIEYLFFSLIRRQFDVSHALGVKIASVSIMAMLLAPVFIYISHRLARMVGYNIVNEGITRSPYVR